MHIKKSRCQKQPNLYARYCPPVLFCWFNRPRLNQNISVQTLNQHKNDIKIAIGGYRATLMYEEIASTDDGTPSGFTLRRGKGREVTAPLKGECASTVLYANRWKRIYTKFLTAPYFVVYSLYKIHYNCNYLIVNLNLTTLRSM
ncbi:MAG: hypothetical protein HYW13_01190 [Planctomycetes bacterium]|nr:hypothetical protein [Planctomycetota bacterium]